MLIIRRRDAARRMARYHYLILQPRLLSRAGEAAVDLVHEWGRIGSPGTVRVMGGYGSEAGALAAASVYAARKRRKGYQ